VFKYVYYYDNEDKKTQERKEHIDLIKQKAQKLKSSKE
jgi:hypothetical protein